ncbi:MAG: extracellular solute-binding protein [Eubacterium sp.]|nr:extracellular solute-binding protein [Eubacterium sp.]
MSTIKDVAQLAQVSTATVSNYINHTKPVSETKAARIRAAIEELDYAQNQSARMLKMSTNMDIGVLVPTLNDSYYSQIYEGIKSHFAHSPYNIRIKFTKDIPEQETLGALDFLKLGVSGLILVSCQPDKWEFYYKKYTKHSIPLVMIDREIQNMDANFVSFDNRNMVREITETLLDKEYTKPLLFTGSERFTCEQACRKGFLDGLKSSGAKPDRDRIVTVDMNKEDAFRKALSVLQKKHPDAIVTTSETVASGVIEAMSVLGYGTNDIPVYSLGEEHWNIFTHSFSTQTVKRPAIRLGEVASQLLDDQMQSPLTKESERRVLNGGHLDKSPANNNYAFVKHPHRLEKDMTGEELNILFLDTPQVHSLLELLPNFINRTGIRVNAQMLPHHNLYETILEKNEQLPTQQDIYMYDIPWLRSLASRNVLEDLTDSMYQLDQNAFFPNCMQYYSTHRGRYYGIPFMYAPQIFYYRKDLFDDPGLQADYRRQSNLPLRPPVTLKEYNTLAAFFTHQTDAVPYGITVPTAYSECLTPEIYMRLYAYGGSLFDAKNRVTIESAEGLSAYINFLQSIANAKPDYETATDNSAAADFLNGETAMLISYPSFLKDNTDFQRNTINGSIGYHMLPGKHPLLGGWDWVSTRIPNIRKRR